MTSHVPAGGCHLELRHLTVHIYLYIYLYIYIFRERSFLLLDVGGYDGDESREPRQCWCHALRCPVSHRDPRILQGTLTSSQSQLTGREMAQLFFFFFLCVFVLFFCLEDEMIVQGADLVIFVVPYRIYTGSPAAGLTTRDWWPQTH